MLNLDSIRTFCTVVETGNFRKAALRLHRTQPAITQQIKRLESELGQTLLDRAQRIPTPQGRILYEKGLALLLESQNIAAEIADLDHSITHELRVGTSDTNALYFLPQHVRKFSQLWPDIKLEIYSRSTDAVADEVERGKLDLGIITLPLSNAALEMQALFHQHFVLVVPNSHHLAKRKQVSLNKLPGESFVLLEESTRTGTLLNGFFTRHDFTPTVSMHSGSFEVIKRYVAEGIGIALLPEMVLTPQDSELLAAVRVPDVPEIGIGAIWRKGSYRSRAAAAFLDLLSQ